MDRGRHEFSLTVVVVERFVQKRKVRDQGIHTRGGVFLTSNLCFGASHLEDFTRFHHVINYLYINSKRIQHLPLAPAVCPPFFPSAFRIRLYGNLGGINDEEFGLKRYELQSSKIHCKIEKKSIFAK